MDRHQFGTGPLRAAVTAKGAELCSLRTEGAGEWLWPAGPAWPRHAPVLFPIVGRLADDIFRHHGFTSRVTQHGFARDRSFRFERADADGCRLSLEDDEDTRRIYPFAFRLEIDHAVRGATLQTIFRLWNTGGSTLHASLGTHPAFRWPLAPGLPKEAHRLRFERDEFGPVRRLEGGLLSPEPVASPIRGDILPLSEELFAADALILAEPRSRSVRYEADATDLAITVEWDGFTELGIWSKPADFVCIEPWSGFSSPTDFRGDFADKPGTFALASGEVAERRLRVVVSGP